VARPRPAGCWDAGRRVAVVERELIGGECAYWACIPSKTLLRGPKARASAGQAAGVSTPALAWPGLRDYRDYMIRHLDDAAQPLPCLAAPAAGKNLAVFLAIMPGATLAGLYGQYGTRLLELNTPAPSFRPHGRALPARLTAVGQHKLAAARAAVIAIEQRMTAALPPQHAAGLLADLGRMAQALEPPQRTPRASA
jgi:hypothetical protein